MGSLLQGDLGQGSSLSGPGSLPIRRALGFSLLGTRRANHPDRGGRVPGRAGPRRPCGWRRHRGLEGAQVSTCLRAPPPAAQRALPRLLCRGHSHSPLSGGGGPRGVQRDTSSTLTHWPATRRPTCPCPGPQGLVPKPASCSAEPELHCPPPPRHAVCPYSPRAAAWERTPVAQALLSRRAAGDSSCGSSGALSFPIY